MAKNALNKLDTVDISILRLLQKDARISYTEIGKKLNISSATVYHRVNKLAGTEVIKGYFTEVDYYKLGYSVTALMGVSVAQGSHMYPFIKALKNIPEIEEVHITAGSYDLLLKIRARNTAHLEDLIINEIQNIKGFNRSDTTIILSTPLERRGGVQIPDLD